MIFARNLKKHTGILLWSVVYFNPITIRVFKINLFHTTRLHNKSICFTGFTLVINIFLLQKSDEIKH